MPPWIISSKKAESHASAFFDERNISGMMLPLHINRLPEHGINGGNYL